MISAEDLAAPKAEGKIALAMTSGFWGLNNFPTSFSKLKRVVGLSDPALAKALKELLRAGVLERTADGRYRLNPEMCGRLQVLLRPFYSGHYIHRARSVAEKLKAFEEVAAVIVFGSTAQGKATWSSDTDLLIVLKDRNEELEDRIRKLISELCRELNVMFEEVFISLQGLRTIVEREYRFLFGLVEGYRCLLDRAKIGDLLRRKEADIERRYKYIEEVGMWLLRR